MKYKLRELQDKLSCFFRPRQKWLTKKIPNSWCDKVELVPITLFAILIDFVEEENGLSQMDCDWDEEIKAGFISQFYVDSIMGTCTELKAAYDYIKVEKPLLEKRLENSYPEVEFEKDGKISTKLSGSYDEIYGETNRLEKELHEKDLNAMMTIVKHYKFLWT